jgi:hypothetical protein
MGEREAMDLDTLLLRYFGTADPESLSPEALAAGREAVTIAFAVERDAGRRFALWALLAGTGGAPLPSEAFPDEPALRAAANRYLDAAERLE